MQLTAVITGASAGIGEAIARQLAQEGYRLVLLARRKDRLEALRQDLGVKNIHVFDLDVSSRNAVEKIFLAIEQEVGNVDILVNNAGIAPGLERAQNASLEDWEKCIATNINGMVFCTHAVLPSMVKRNHGHIVNLGSVAGTYPYPGGNVYCGTKAFVHQFSLSLRADLLGTQVRVTCIEPGLLGGTEFSFVRFHGDAEKANEVYKGTAPLRAEDVAKTVQFCIDLPQHVNINRIELMPVGQAFAPLQVNKIK
jgi:3-hydroxy acid dehydrogenase / malonic semialdehyde reductase